MQTIKEHIKNNQYKPVYLLYGSEDYLKKLYQEKLKHGLTGDGDDMNFSVFEGKGIDLNSVAGIAQTLPFFSERRLILIKNSGLFKNQSDFSEVIKEMPETTIFVFVESEVDKRNRLFKIVKEVGYISEMNGMDERNLKLWITSLLKQEGKKITERDVVYLLNKSGTEMKNLQNEIEKLVCYSYNREVVTASDIDAVCTTHVTGKIFQMIDAIGAGKQSVALNLYYDLLILREKPLSILFLLTRHFNILLQVKDLDKHGHKGTEIAGKAGIPPFTVSKYLTQAKNFKRKKLMEILENCVEVEEQIKTGRLTDAMGIELLIVSYSSPAK